jgi:hypothetical protein
VCVGGGMGHGGKTCDLTRSCGEEV